MIKLYGASDDLIEVEGDIREEYDAWGQTYDMEFSTGDTFRIHYTDQGTWNIEPRTTVSSYDHFAVEPEDEAKGKGYTDIVILNADVEWVKAVLVND